MNVSIVIPVYNEAERLDACLRSISMQATSPLEVIVVDNNSSDDSVIIAKRYSFVTLLKEQRQGVVHARNLGFDTARGDIIGRIDADTLLPSNWVTTVESIFSSNEDISAVSGAPNYYDFAWKQVADNIDHRLRDHLAQKLGQTNFLWGANMAIRRADWNRVRSSLCDEDNMHEDFDLAIHLQDCSLNVVYDSSLLAGVSSRRVDTSFRAYARYSLISPRTYALHKIKSRYHMYPVVAFCWAIYIPARVAYRGYNPETGTFSLNRLLMTTSPRVDPTSNVI